MHTSQNTRETDMRVGHHIGHNLYDDDNNCIGHMHKDIDAEVLVALDNARIRTLQALQEVRDRQGPSGMINASQVIGLLSPTWPDGNYSNV
jgi:hypothetical protein